MRENNDMAQSHDEIDLLAILQILWIHRLFLVVGTVIGLFVGGIYYVMPSKSPATYTATAQVKLSYFTSFLNAGDYPQVEVIGNLGRMLNSEIAFIKTDAVLAKLSDALLSHGHPLNGDENLRSMISVSTPRNTFLINMSVTSPDPDRAIVIVNTLTQVYAAHRNSEYVENLPSFITVTQPAMAASLNEGKNAKMIVAIITILTFFASIAAVLAYRFMKNTPLQSTDIQNQTGRPVLFEIAQDANETSHTQLRNVIETRVAHILNPVLLFATQENTDIGNDIAQSYAAAGIRTLTLDFAALSEAGQNDPLGKIITGMSKGADPVRINLAGFAGLENELSSPDFWAAFAKARQQFDRIIISGVDMSPASHFVTLQGHADLILGVVGWNKTKLRPLQNLLNYYNNLNIAPDGFVMINVDTKFMKRNFLPTTAL